MAHYRSFIPGKAAVGWVLGDLNDTALVGERYLHITLIISKVDIDPQAITSCRPKFLTWKSVSDYSSAP